MTDFYFPFVPKPGHNFDWQGINRAYDWLHALAATLQDPIYHQEGDVLTHTYMVLESLISLKEWQRLKQSDREVLFWAALLHDVAKPKCTRHGEQGRIASPNHTVLGERLAREIMWRGIPEPVPFLLKERIAKLVRFHGLPLWFLEHKDPLKSLIRASQLIKLKHLSLLAEADVLGRIGDNKNEYLERILLFREYAKEAGCYEGPYPFASDLARLDYLNSKDRFPDYVPYDQTWGEVVLMSGLPGAGKDSWIKDNLADWPSISLDDLRQELGIKPEDNQGKLVQESKKRAKELLRKKRPFVWNATNITWQVRKPLIDMFFAYGAKVRIVYIECDCNRLFRQNADRKKAVPEKTINTLITKLDMPNINEANYIEYVVTDGNGKSFTFEQIKNS